MTHGLEAALKVNVGFDGNSSLIPVIYFQRRFFLKGTYFIFLLFLTLAGAKKSLELSVNLQEKDGSSDRV